MSDEYDVIPFGEEWEKEMMKFRKIELIDWVRRALEENRQLRRQEEIK